MEPVNRFAVVVRPTRRYAEWVEKVDRNDKDPVPYDLGDARANPTVYLIAADEHEPDPSQLIDRYSAEIFEQELDAWCTDETVWPRDRSPEVFRDWFDVTVSDMLFDLDEDEPIHDESQEEVDDEGGRLMCAWCREPIEKDADVTTVTLMGGGEHPPQRKPTFVLVPLAGRDVPVMVPSDDSRAGREGAAGVVMFCSEICAKFFEDAWARERGVIRS